MKYAGFWKRFCANFLDVLIYLPIGAICMWLDSQSKTIALMLLIPTSLLWPVYDIYFHARWGQTLGKMVMKIRVLTVAGTAITYREAFLRYSVSLVFGVVVMIAQFIALVRFPSEEYVSLGWERSQRLDELQPAFFHWISWIGFAWIWSEVIVILLNQKRRALHDYIAGTVVVRLDGEASVAEQPAIV